MKKILTIILAAIITLSSLLTFVGAETRETPIENVITDRTLLTAEFASVFDVAGLTDEKENKTKQITNNVLNYLEDYPLVKEDEEKLIKELKELNDILVKYNISENTSVSEKEYEEIMLAVLEVADVIGLYHKYNLETKTMYIYVRNIMLRIDYNGEVMNLTTIPLFGFQSMMSEIMLNRYMVVKSIGVTSFGIASNILK